MNAERPLVTIGIPTYNRAGSTLPITLESALAQDYPNLEIVISDNCSSDNTKALVASRLDSRVTYIRQEKNIGPNNNYNACLDAAQGDYFILLHDDDLIDKDFVSTCMARAGYEKGYGVIRTGTRMVDGDGAVIKERPNTVSTDVSEDLYRAWVTGKTGFYLCSTLFNKAALQETGGFKSKNNLFEDGIAIIRIVRKWPILNIRETKASFRQHGDQLTHAAAAKRWSEDFRQAIDLIGSFSTEHGAALHEMGMKNFSKVSLHFARKVENPLKRAAAVFGLCRHFPCRYWPRESLKIRLIGWLGTAYYNIAGQI